MTEQVKPPVLTIKMVPAGVELVLAALAKLPHEQVAEGPFQGVGMFFPYVVYSYTFTDTAIVLAFLNTRGIMRHDPRWAWLIGNHHLLHHKYSEYNFGEYWIDTLCGTRYPLDSEYKYGLIYV